MDRNLRLVSCEPDSLGRHRLTQQCKFTEKFSTASYNLEKNFSNCQEFLFRGLSVSLRDDSLASRRHPEKSDIESDFSRCRRYILPING